MHGRAMNIQADTMRKPLAAAASPALAIIVPTFNEARNVVALVTALDAALVGIPHEVVFVDDWSTDGTPEIVADMARARADVRLIRRYARRGLSSAVVEGALATTAPVVAIIDGDLQHDETILPMLYAAVAVGEDGTVRADIAVGTRYAPGGSTGDWDAGRVRMSTLATRAARALTSIPVSDPMSGYFAMRTDTLVALVPRLSVLGFKILLDILMSAPAPLVVREVPYRFRTRIAGTSKLDTAVALDLVLLVLDKRVGRWIPPRLILFGAVGGFGLLVHLALLRLFLGAGQAFQGAQALAVTLTIVVNFGLNNQLTFRDRRLRGRALIGGLLSFYLVCGLGAIANVGIGSVIYASHYEWWLAGTAGAVIGSIWNYAASSIVTWKKR